MTSCPLFVGGDNYERVKIYVVFRLDKIYLVIKKRLHSLKRESTRTLRGLKIMTNLLHLPSMHVDCPWINILLIPHLSKSQDQNRFDKGFAIKSKYHLYFYCMMYLYRGLTRCLSSEFVFYFIFEFVGWQWFVFNVDLSWFTNFSLAFRPFTTLPGRYFTNSNSHVSGPI